MLLRRRTSPGWPRRLQIGRRRLTCCGPDLHRVHSTHVHAAGCLPVRSCSHSSALRGILLPSTQGCSPPSDDNEDGSAAPQLRCRRRTWDSHKHRGAQRKIGTVVLGRSAWWSIGNNRQNLRDRPTSISQVGRSVQVYVGHGIRLMPSHSDDQPYPAEWAAQASHLWENQTLRDPCSTATPSYSPATCDTSPQAPPSFPGRIPVGEPGLDWEVVADLGIPWILGWTGVSRMGFEPRTLGLKVRARPSHAVPGRTRESRPPVYTGLAVGLSSHRPPPTPMRFIGNLLATPHGRIRAAIAWTGRWGRRSLDAKHGIALLMAA